MGQSRALTEVLPRVRDILGRRGGRHRPVLGRRGPVDCYYERGPNPWDWAAGVLVAEESGMVVGGPAGECPSTALIWAAPRTVADEFEALLRTARAHLD